MELSRGEREEVEFPYEGNAYVTCALGERGGGEENRWGRGYGDSPAAMEDVASVGEEETKGVEGGDKAAWVPPEPPAAECAVMVSAVPVVGYPASYGQPIAMVGMAPPPQLVMCPSPYMYCPICAGVESAAAAAYGHPHYAGPKPPAAPVAAPLPAAPRAPAFVARGERAMDYDDGPAPQPVPHRDWDADSYDTDESDDEHDDHFVPFGISPPGGGC